MATLAEIAAEAGSARRRCRACSTTSPGSATAPARRSSPRSTCSATSARPACASAAPAWSGWSSRSWRTRSSRRSRRSSRTRSARRATRRCCAPRRPGGITEDEYVESLLDHGVAGIVFVSGLHADRAPTTSRYRTLVARGLPVVFINGYVEGSTRRSSPPTTARRWRIAVVAPGPARPHADRAGHRPGPVRAGAAQARGLRGRPRRARSAPHPSEAERWIAEALFTRRGRRRGRPAAARPRRDRRSSAART